MLFKQEELGDTVSKWATENKIAVDEDTFGYLHSATDGHPGMVGLLLKYFELWFSKVIPQICSKFYH